MYYLALAKNAGLNSKGLLPSFKSFFPLWGHDKHHVPKMKIWGKDCFDYHAPDISYGFLQSIRMINVLTEYDKGIVGIDQSNEQHDEDSVDLMEKEPPKEEGIDSLTVLNKYNELLEDNANIVKKNIRELMEAIVANYLSKDKTEINTRQEDAWFIHEYTEDVVRFYCNPINDPKIFTSYARRFKSERDIWNLHLTHVQKLWTSTLHTTEINEIRGLHC